jgi:hypothetical protein
MIATRKIQEVNRRRRDKLPPYAQSTDVIVRELQLEREREREREREADAAKTARLRAQRLAREAAGAVEVNVTPKGRASS